VPKAKPFPEDYGDERTTIEANWEEEPSTTAVEEGEIADKLRSAAEPARVMRSAITGSGATSLEEPTLDDQRANPQIAAIGSSLVGRLVITQGNDVGQEFEISPGKAYTIGRAIDNDVVLTDIAVSRKHFDLRCDDGAWVIVDHGSGNGTVVNGNLEDQPYSLSNGDVIEIGNTVFRFDGPLNQGRRKLRFPDDGAEASTVAGKPMLSDAPAHERVTARERSKSAPPPTPLRPRSVSPAPPLQMPQSTPPQPASTLSLPGRLPFAAPSPAPSMLAAPISAPLPAAMAPTFSAQVTAQRPTLASYPQLTDLPQQNVYGNGILIAPNGTRNDASTVHVAPTPFTSGGGTFASPMRVPVPQLTRRAKLILAGSGLVLLAGITSIAVVKSSGPTTAKAESLAAGSGALTEDKSITLVNPAKPIATDPPKSITSNPPKPIATDPAKPITTDPPKSITSNPPKVVIVTPKSDPPKKDPTTHPDSPPKKAGAPKVTQKDPPPKKDPPPHEDPPPKKEPSPKKVAIADSGDARTKADALYRAKKFSEASRVVAAAAKSADDTEARELRHLADLYVRVGRGMSAGTTSSAKDNPTDAFTTLRQTENYDRAAGGAFSNDIEEALAKIAPKAATAYMSEKNYEQARIAVAEAEKLGAGTTGTTMVKQALERAAQDLYGQANKEASSDPASAKDKCKRILNFADSKGTWYQKAARLSNSL
jgi:hypothetical protein